MIYSFKPTRNLHPLALSQIGTLGAPEENRWSALDGSHSNAEVGLVLESRAQTIGGMPLQLKSRSAAVRKRDICDKGPA
jgi:hypothetical protein